jgi:hypothetical protein
VNSGCTFNAQTLTDYKVTVSVYDSCGEYGSIDYNLTTINKNITYTLISAKSELQSISYTGNYFLTADIDMENSATNISNGSTAFTGGLNGNGHTIRNFQVNITASGATGFFALTNNAWIQNLTLSGSVMNNYADTDFCTTGLLAGTLNQSNVRDVHLSGSVQCNQSLSGIGNDGTGGLAGYSYNYTTILKSSAAVNVTSITPAYAGGFIGYLENSTVNECSSSGTVQGATGAGGFAGKITDSTLSKCYSTGNVTSSTSGAFGIGGFAGIIKMTSAHRIEQCYSNCSVIADPNVGQQGIEVGGFTGDVEKFTESRFINCYARGSISGYNQVGGFAGYLAAANSASNCYASVIINAYAYASKVDGFNAGQTGQSDCYYDSLVSGRSDTYATAKSTDDMKKQLTFAGWDFTNIWAIDSTGKINDGYPYLLGVTE